MPLCGSSTCGCALVSVPAVTGAINGDLPTIDVAGNGTPASPWNLTLNGEWAAEVVGELGTVVGELDTRGVVGIAKTSGTAQTGITAQADVTGLTYTWTANASRIYRTTLNINVSKSGTADNVSAYIMDGSNVGISARTQYFRVSDLLIFHMEWTETGLTGSTTRKVRIECTLGTLSIENAFNRNGILIIEDLGPA